MQTLSFLLFVLVVALQAADAYLTWRVLRGGGRELNPVVRFLMQELGTVAGLAVAKVALVVVIWIFLLDHPVWMALVTGLYVWVVVHNWNQLAHAGNEVQGV